MQKLKLLFDLPINIKHGAVKGATFNIVRMSNKKGRGNKLIYFIGNAGEECGAYMGECEILPEK